MNAKAVEHLAAFAKAMREHREDEERRGRALLVGAGLDSVALPLEIERGYLKGLSATDRAVLIRELARRSELSVLSRARCQELARLMEGRGAFVFPWGKCVVVRGDSLRVLWVRRIDGALHF